MVIFPRGGRREAPDQDTLGSTQALHGTEIYQYCVRRCAEKTKFCRRSRRRHTASIAFSRLMPLSLSAGCMAVALVGKVCAAVRKYAQMRFAESTLDFSYTNVRTKTSPIPCVFDPRKKCSNFYLPGLPHGHAQSTIFFSHRGRNQRMLQKPLFAATRREPKE